MDIFFWFLVTVILVIFISVRAIRLGIKNIFSKGDLKNPYHYYGSAIVLTTLVYAIYPLTHWIMRDLLGFSRMNTLPIEYLEWFNNPLLNVGFCFFIVSFMTDLIRLVSFDKHKKISRTCLIVSELSALVALGIYIFIGASAAYPYLSELTVDYSNMYREQGINAVLSLMLSDLNSGHNLWLLLFISFCGGAVFSLIGWLSEAPEDKKPCFTMAKISFVIFVVIASYMGINHYLTPVVPAMAP